MCCTNDLTTILLILLTFLLTTMPTTTTTTTTSTATASGNTKTKGTIKSDKKAIFTNSNIDTRTKRISLAVATAIAAEEQQQQHTNVHNAQAFESLLQQQLHPAMDIATAGTQPLPLPLQNDDSLLAVPVSSPVNSHVNLNFRSSTGRNANNNNNNNNLNMDHNSVDEQQNAVDETTEPPPLFDFGIPRNITARSGQTAAIACRVEHLADKMVAWIRKRDLHILTVGMITYSSDERFEVKHVPNSKDWALHVKYAQPRDTGIYECQVNTEPKISMAFRLNVIVTPPDAKAIIAGPTDLYVKVGSAITLTCHVKRPTTAQDIGPIYWYRGPYILTPFVAHPNEAAIDLQRISMESKLGEKLQSRLRIANAQPADSGNYTCMPTTADAASVMVNVINDESPAAMQKSAAPSNKTYCRQIAIAVSLLMLASCCLTALPQLQSQSQPSLKSPIATTATLCWRQHAPNSDLDTPELHKMRSEQLLFTAQEHARGASS